MFGKNGMADLMKQAKKMQDDLEKSQKELENTQIIGMAANGLVKYIVKGNHTFVALEVDNSLHDDVEMLLDLIQIAIKDAQQKLANITESKMSGVKSMLPPGMKLPF